jgi:hypothetical protein
VTQHNAAAAEELSSTAEEMSSQAEALQQMMVSLQKGQVLSKKNKTGVDLFSTPASAWPARGRAGFHAAPVEQKDGKNRRKMEAESPVSVETENNQDFKRF